MDAKERAIVGGFERLLTWAGESKTKEPPIDLAKIQQEIQEAKAEMRVLRKKFEPQLPRPLYWAFREILRKAFVEDWPLEKIEKALLEEAEAYEDFLCREEKSMSNLKKERR